MTFNLSNNLLLACIFLVTCYLHAFFLMIDTYMPVPIQAFKIIAVYLVHLFCNCMCHFIVFVLTCASYIAHQ